MAGAVAETLWWPLPAAAHGLLLAVQAPAPLLLLGLAWRWSRVQSLRIRMLAMLHGGFVWFGLALALAALSHARVLWLGEPAALGLAPLHALSMGYLGLTLIAMVTRVVATHSGRSQAADDRAWALYLLVQCAVLLRVVAALWPAAATPLSLSAATAWLAGCGGWALRYGNWLGRPRVDGRPG
ncbi:MAG: NnrS family protein [Rubrivivax sp.]|nr:NnrS family protein [Rubrivivax sp.]